VLRTSVFALIAPASAAAARLILSNRLIGGTGGPQGLVLCTAAGEQECDVVTISVSDRNGNPVELFSVAGPLLSAIMPSGGHRQPLSVTIESREQLALTSGEGAVSRR
jgi:hypothetical protein